MQEFNEGDLVEAVRGESVIRGRVSKSYSGLRIEAAGWGVESLKVEGFTIAVIEKATPPLPTEPGWYLAYDRVAEKAFPIECRDDALWFGYPRPQRLGDPERFGPFTRLEPVPVTVKRFAEKVKFELRAPGAWTTDKVVDVVATQFGVTE